MKIQIKLINYIFIRREEEKQLESILKAFESNKTSFVAVAHYQVWMNNIRTLKLIHGST